MPPCVLWFNTVWPVVFPDLQRALDLQLFQPAHPVITNQWVGIQENLHLVVSIELNSLEGVSVQDADHYVRQVQFLQIVQAAESSTGYHFFSVYYQIEFLDSLGPLPNVLSEVSQHVVSYNYGFQGLKSFPSALGNVFQPIIEQINCVHCLKQLESPVFRVIMQLLAMDRL